MKFLEFTNKINFRDLALVNIISIVLINLLIIYLSTRTVVFNNEQFVDYKLRLSLLSIIADVLFFSGIIFTIVSLMRNEPKDFRLKLCIWSYPVLILLIISMYLGRNVFS